MDPFAGQHRGAFRRGLRSHLHKCGNLKSLDFTGRAWTVVEDRIATFSDGDDIAAVFEDFGGSC